MMMMRMLFVLSYDINPNHDDVGFNEKESVDVGLKVVFCDVDWLGVVFVIILDDIDCLTIVVVVIVIVVVVG